MVSKYQPNEILESNLKEEEEDQSAKIQNAIMKEEEEQDKKEQSNVKLCESDIFQVIDSVKQLPEKEEAVLPEKEEAQNGPHDPNEVVPVSSVFIDLGDVDEESGEIKVMEFNKFKKLKEK